MTASSTSAAFSQQTAAWREQIDTALAGYIDLSADCPPQLAEAMRYSLLAPGKRLRPLLVLLAAEACGGTHSAAMPAACAAEMIHAYSLIHDDLPAMDDDDLRRGRPTCHKAFDEATAILAGDGLLTLAFDVLARHVQPPAVAAQCCATLAVAAGAEGMVAGQVDDLQHEQSAALAESSDAQLKRLESIHRRKTGAMFRAALRLGGLTAAASDLQLAALDGFATRLGLAFQITDDLLDVTGDEATVGKRLGKDSDRGKLTFPALLGVEESSARAAQLIDEACGLLTPFAARADGLEAVARYVLERNH